MKLRFRGAEYSTHSNSIKMVEEVIGQYRGAIVTRRVAKNVPNQHIEGLTYRGAVVH